MSARNITLHKAGNGSRKKRGKEIEYYKRLGTASL